MTHDPDAVKERSTEETYWIASNTSPIEALHTDRECVALQNAAAHERVTRAQYPTTPVCSWCAGEASRSADPRTLASTLRAADSLEELREGSEV